MAREMRENPSGEKKLEQYGVWVKVEPQAFTATGQSEDALELTDLESTAPASLAPAQTAVETALTLEEEQLLDELGTEISQNQEEGTSGVQGFDLEAESTLEAPGEEVLPELELEDIGVPEASRASESEGVLAPSREPSIELLEESFPAETKDLEELPDIEKTMDAVEVPLSEGLPREEHFDDLAALEEELASVSASPAISSSKGSQAVSGEILARIEEELKSIRSDLVSLKGELSSLKKGKPAAGKAESAAESAGYFDEDEDETIALTGDELDNILSTAEITEESAEGAGAQAETETDALAGLTGHDDILSYDTSLASETGESALEAGEIAIPELPEDLTMESMPSEIGSAEPIADLELESLEMDEGTAAQTQVSQPETPSDEGLELDLEEIPEIEEPSGTADLDTLQLQEEIPAAESDEIPSLDLESLPEAEGTAGQAGNEGEIPSLGDEIDLQILPEEEPGELPLAETSDIELDELEALPEAEGAGEEKEIEIEFEEQEKTTGEKNVPPEDSAPLEEVMEVEEVPEIEAPPRAGPQKTGTTDIPDDLKDEIRTVLKYMDQLLEALPEEKIQEFASSEYFVMYKKLFEDLGLGE